MKSGDLIFIPQNIYVARDYQGVPAILKKKFFVSENENACRSGWECVIMGYAGTSTPGSVVRFYNYQLGFEK